MLMEETTKSHGQEQTEKSDEAIIQIGNYPVMESAIDVLTILGKKNKVILKSKGNSIPNAVAVANIITEKMLKGGAILCSYDFQFRLGIGLIKYIFFKF